MPAIMAASFVLILAFGKRLPKKGSEIGIAAVGLCFVFALAAGGSWISRVNDAQHSTPATTATESAAQGNEVVGENGGGGGGAEEHPVEPVTTGKTWFEAGGVKIEVGTLVDGLSVMMFIVVTTISLLVHVY